MEASKQLNKIAKYIYRHIDGAYKLKFGPSTADVYMFMYYQEEKGGPLKEMKFDISLVTYQNKIRINLNEMSFLEDTIGQDIYRPEQLENLDEMYPKIYNKLIQHINVAYADYDFVY